MSALNEYSRFKRRGDTFSRSVLYFRGSLCSDNYHNKEDVLSFNKGLSKHRLYKVRRKLYFQRVINIEVHVYMLKYHIHQFIFSVFLYFIFHLFHISFISYFIYFIFHLFRISFIPYFIYFIFHLFHISFISYFIYFVFHLFHISLS